MGEKTVNDMLDDLAVRVIDELQELLKKKGIHMSERGYEKLCDELRYALVVRVE